MLQDELLAAPDAVPGLRAAVQLQPGVEPQPALAVVPQLALDVLPDAPPA